MINDYRYEIKFVLNQREIAHALSWLNMIGAKKVFPDRKVNSLYFDNVDQQALRDNLAGITHRSKIRLRWYGDNFSDTMKPNLEIKVRENHFNYKIIYPITTTLKELKKKNLHLLSKEIFQEIYSSKFTHHSINDYLVPMILINYNREYYNISKVLRITIDKHIRFFNAAQNSKIESLQPISYNYNIMEIKFPINSKNFVSEMIKPLCLTRKRHSKYLAGLSMLGYAKYI